MKSLAPRKVRSLLEGTSKLSSELAEVAMENDRAKESLSEKGESMEEIRACVIMHEVWGSGAVKKGQPAGSAGKTGALSDRPRRV